MNFDRDDELVHPLAGTMPRGAPPELRRDVLDAVARELASANGRSTTAWLAWGVAALVLLAVGLNVAVGMNEERRMARLRRHHPQRADVAELAETVVTLTDKASADRFRDYLARMLPRRAAPPEARPPESWPQNEIRAVGGVLVDP